MYDIMQKKLSINIQEKVFFSEIEGYDEIVLVKDIPLQSHCEHHIVPILGWAHVGYLPNKRIVGISKLARVVDIFGKRLQTQEVMTCLLYTSPSPRD